MNITMFAGGLNPLATLCLKLGFGFSAASTAVTSGMLNPLATYKATIGTTLNFIATTASNVFPIGALIDRSYLAAAFVVVS